MYALPCGKWEEVVCNNFLNKLYYKKCDYFKIETIGHVRKCQCSLSGNW